MEIDFKKIEQIYGIEMIEEIRDNLRDVNTNVNYLLKIGFNDVEDIFERYAPIFICSNKNFIEKIINVCKGNNIEITGSVFKSQASEIEEIIKVCRENNIEITGSVFQKQASEIEEIIKVCRENNIEIIGSVFLKNAKQLQKNIDYIKSNFDSRYLMPLIVSKNLKQLQEIMPYLQEKGVLEVLITSASILTLTLEEVKERENFILSIGENITSKGKFNSIFGLSRKNYQLKKEKYSAIK